MWKKATCNPSMGEESRGTPELLGLGEGVQVRLWASAVSHPVGPGNQAQCVASGIFAQSFSGSPPRLLKQGVLLYLKLPDPLHWLALEFSGLAYSPPA